jgi:poly-gamma-glutamate system protein
MNRTVRLTAAGILSLAAFSLIELWPSGAAPRCADAMVRAGQIMEQAIQALRDRREKAGARFDPGIDPNRTGLIGPEHTPLATTLGELQAKRSTTNPNVAGYIVYLLCKAGVQPGDSVAIGSSGSFPALMVASLAAAKAMNVRPVTILSLGASSYGATDPDFNLLDIYEILASKGISSAVPAAASLGGEKDIGLDFDSEVRHRLADRIRAAGVAFLHEPDLEKNVSERLRIYEHGASRRIAAFINSGGGYANLGTSHLALNVRPGLNADLSLPPPTERGVLFEMAARKVPVIHLLFIKGLVTEAGLPWDPIPLPKPVPLRLPGAARGSGFWLITAAYFALLFLLAAYPRQNT